MEGKLKFYEIEGKYIKYLKTFDNQVPNINYQSYNKFLCGIVLKINNNNYYAPVSSFSKQQQTNFIIKNENGKPISSIRLSFMIPVIDRVLHIKDFSKEDYKYQRLLIQELKYCNDNIKKILNKANKVYKIGTNLKHPLNKTCCNFKLLEEKCLQYIETAEQYIATTKDIEKENESEDEWER